MAELQKEKTYKIKLPKDRHNNEDVFVSVNERTWLIQRGVEVEVPACVYEVLQHQERVLDELAMLEERATKG